MNFNCLIPRNHPTPSPQAAHPGPLGISLQIANPLAKPLPTKPHKRALSFLGQSQSPTACKPIPLLLVDNAALSTAKAPKGPHLRPW